MAKCFVIKLLGEIDNDNLPIYDTFVIHVTPNVANAGNLSARAITFLSPKDIVIRTKDGGNHIAYVQGDYITIEPTNLTNEVTVPANTQAGVYMKDDTEYDVLVSGLYSFTYIGSTNGGSSQRAFGFDINQLSNSTNLQTLDIINPTQITGDIASFKGLTNLQTLKLNNRSSKLTGDIANLKGLTNLQTLDIFAPQISGDIANLKGLTNLQTFNINDAQLSGDIANLKDLTNLQTLNLHGTQVSGDIASFKGLTNLQTLLINDAQVSGDITELKTLVNLTTFGARPGVPKAITGDVKVLFDAMAKTNRNDSCEITWNRTACTYSGDTSITPTEAKRFIKATFDGNGGYTVTNYGS